MPRGLTAKDEEEQDHRFYCVCDDGIRWRKLRDRAGCCGADSPLASATGSSCDSAADGDAIGRAGEAPRQADIAGAGAASSLGREGKRSPSAISDRYAAGDSRKTGARDRNATGFRAGQIPREPRRRATCRVDAKTEADV